MNHLFRTLAAGSAIAFALAACSTDMGNRWNSDSTSGSTMSNGTTGSSTATTHDKYYNGQPTPYGAGEAGATPTPASGSTTIGTTRGQ